MFDKLKNKMKGNKKKSHSSRSVSSSDKKRNTTVQGSNRYKKNGGHTSS